MHSGYQMSLKFSNYHVYVTFAEENIDKFSFSDYLGETLANDAMTQITIFSYHYTIVHGYSLSNDIHHDSYPKSTELMLYIL